MPEEKPSLLEKNVTFLLTKKMEELYQEALRQYKTAWLHLLLSWSLFAVSFTFMLLFYSLYSLFGLDRTSGETIGFIFLVMALASLVYGVYSSQRFHQCKALFRKARKALREEESDSAPQDPKI
jgi:hypothetical protein